MNGIGTQDLPQRVIERGFGISPRVQAHSSREALLIFAATAMVYLNALDKEPPQQMRDWIG